MRRPAAVAIVLLTIGALSNCATSTSAVPSCSGPEDHLLVLLAQSVPTATRLPCIADLPAGWTYGGSLVQSDSAKLWLDSDRAGYHAVEVEMLATCDVSSAVEVPPAPDELATTVFQQPRTLTPALTGNRYQVFEGGCIVYRYRFSPGADPILVIEADQALSSIPRSSVVERVKSELGLTVCGAGADPCAG